MGPKKLAQGVDSTVTRVRTAGSKNRNAATKSSLNTSGRAVSNVNSQSQPQLTKKSLSPSKRSIQTAKKTSSPTRISNLNLSDQNRRSPSRNISNLPIFRLTGAAKNNSTQNQSKRSTTPGRKQDLSLNNLTKSPTKSTATSNKNLTPRGALTDQSPRQKERSRSISKRNKDEGKESSKTTKQKVNSAHLPHLVALNKDVIRFNQEKAKLASKSRNLLILSEKDKALPRDDKKKISSKERSNITPKTILKTTTTKVKDVQKRLDAGDSSMKRFECVSQFLQDAIEVFEEPVRDNNISIKTEIRVEKDDVCKCKGNEENENTSNDENMNESCLEALNEKLSSVLSGISFDQPNSYVPSFFPSLKEELNDTKISPKEFIDEETDPTGKIKIQSNEFLPVNESDKRNDFKIVSSKSILQNGNFEDKQIRNSDSKMTIQSGTNMSTKTFTIDEPYVFSQIRPSQSNLTVQSFSNLSSKTFTMSESNYGKWDSSPVRPSESSTTVKSNSTTILSESLLKDDIRSIGADLKEEITLDKDKCDTNLRLAEELSQIDNSLLPQDKKTKANEKADLGQMTKSNLNILDTKTVIPNVTSITYEPLFFTLQTTRELNPTKTNNTLENNQIYHLDLEKASSRLERSQSVDDYQNEPDILLSAVNKLFSNDEELSISENIINNTSSVNDNQNEPTRDNANLLGINSISTNKDSKMPACLSNKPSLQVKPANKNNFDTRSLLLNDPLMIGPSSDMRQMLIPLKLPKRNVEVKTSKPNKSNDKLIPLHVSNINKSKHINKSSTNDDLMDQTSFADICASDTPVDIIEKGVVKNDEKSNDITHHIISNKLNCNDNPNNKTDKLQLQNKNLDENNKNVKLIAISKAISSLEESHNQNKSMLSLEHSPANSILDTEINLSKNEIERIKCITNVDLNSKGLYAIPEESENEDNSNEVNIVSVKETKANLEENQENTLSIDENLNIMSQDADKEAEDNMFTNIISAYSQQNLLYNVSNNMFGNNLINESTHMLEPVKCLLQSIVESSNEESDQDTQKLMNLDNKIRLSDEELVSERSEWSTNFGDHLDHIESSCSLNEAGAIKAMRDRGESFEIEYVSDESENVNWNFDRGGISNGQAEIYNTNNRNLYFQDDDDEIASESEEIDQSIEIGNTPWFDYKIAINNNNVNDNIWMVDDDCCDIDETLIYENDWEITEKNLEDLRACLDKCNKEVELADEDIKYVKKKKSKSKKHRKVNKSSSNSSTKSDLRFKSVDIQMNPESTLILDIPPHCDLCSTSKSAKFDDVDYFSVSSSDEICDSGSRKTNKQENSYLSYGKSCKVKKKKKDFLSFLNIFKF